MSPAGQLTGAPALPRDQPSAASSGPIYRDGTGGGYLDLSMGLGSLLFGHGRSEIVAAIQRQVDRGWYLGGGTGSVAEWIGLIKHLVPCAEAVRPTASATEANVLALRLARSATGREWILRFDGHYHGCFDEGLTCGARSADRGLHPLAGSRLLVLDEDDDDRVDDHLATERFAAVIL